MYIVIISSFSLIGLVKIIEKAVCYNNNYTIFIILIFIKGSLLRPNTPYIIPFLLESMTSLEPQV